MIGRRTLIRIAALASGSQYLSAAIAGPVTARARPAPTLLAGNTNTTGVAFKINGWDLRREGAARDPNVDSATEVWISLDRSWRAVWR